MAKRKTSTPKTATVTPGADRSWFVHDRLGMFIHWGLYSMPARHEWVRNKERMTGADYDAKYFKRFDPDLYDPKAWARAAKQAGMKYFVITTKHHEGFCLWNTKYTQYKAPNTPAGRDLLTPMVEAFRAEGIRVGFYYSLIDWNHPEFPVDCLHPQRDDKAFREQERGRDVRKYAEYMRNQVTELLTQFGPIDVLWFDFSYPGEDGKGRDAWESEKLYKLVRKLQPRIMVDNRLDLPGVGDFDTPEQWQPATAPTDAEGKPLVWEACQTFSGSWGYHRDESSWKSVKTLLNMLIDGVSKGGNLLLNVGPTSRGEFDRRALDRLEGMGQWMHGHSRSIYGCGPAPAGLPTPIDCRYTYNAETKRLYVHVFDWPAFEIQCPGLAGKATYAQLLNDGSEIEIQDRGNGVLMLRMPPVRPDVAVPVIEVFMD